MMERKMKDSSVDWIGMIPNDWCVEKGKHFFSQRNTKGNESPVLLAATQKSGMIPQALLEGVVQVKLDTDLQTFKTVHVGDFVISLRSFQGGFEMSDYEGVCSPAYQVFYSTQSIFHKYYKYLFKSYGFISKMNSLVVGIREGKNIQYKDFAESMLPIPPLPIQQRIADFLDRKCAEIDELAALQETMIAELKRYKQSVITEAVTKGLDPNVPMKVSGVEWIGEIPEGWKMGTLNSISLNVRNGYVGPTRDLFVLDGVRYIQSLHIKEGTILFQKHEYYVREEWANEHPRIHTNDLLIVQTGDIGQVALVPEEFDNCGCHALIIVRLDSEICFPKFICYYLMSNVGKELLLQTKTGALLPHLNSGRIGVTPICLPSLTEQHAIAAYLDEKCAEIDELIAVKQQKIEALKEYKKSVIFEYVTGKKEI